MKKPILLILILALLANGLALSEAGDPEILSGAVEESVPEIVDMPLPEADPMEPSGDWDLLAAPTDAAASPTPAPTATPAPSATPLPEPETISVTKKATRTVWLGTDYQIEVPGKTVRSYKSSSKKVALVDADGLVTLVGTGKASITVTLSNKKKFKLTLKVKDPRAPTAVSIGEGSALTLYAGDALQLTAAVSPETADSAVTWKSSKSAVATVDESGLLTAVSPGRASIKVTTVNGKSARLSLTVRRPGRQVVQPYMISHAMGGIGDRKYSNCLEAFQQNYAEGFRVFEVDMEYTSDGRLVLCHDWENRRISSDYPQGYRMSFEEFMGTRIFDKYTPVSLEGLLKLMADYPDVRIITDTKYTDVPTIKRQFTAIVDTAKALGLEDVLHRLVVEIYSEEMFYAIDAIHHFDAYVFTLYKILKKAPSLARFEELAAFCARNGVDMIAMFTTWWKSAYKPILEEYDLDIAVYTTNKKKEAAAFFKDGVTAVLTDFLPPLG